MDSTRPAPQLNQSGPVGSATAVEPPKTDDPHDRQYRAAPVQAVDLPESFVEEAGGAFTREGTLRLDVLAASRAAFLQRKADAAETDALTFDSGEWAPRKEGEHVKSIQGHAEDVWRRIYKRPVPEGDPLDSSEFRRFYDRTRQALKRSELLVDEGPAVQCPDKKRRDKHGKRWSLSGGLREAQSGRETADPPPVVRCKGEPSEADLNGVDRSEDEAGVWTRVERRYAREQDLHREFSHARTARRVDESRWDHRTAEARRWERRYTRDGTEDARHVSIGRWREEAARRDDTRRQWTRTPWLVAELDADTRAENDRLARRLCDRLAEAGANLSAVLVAYSGNKSLHVRIPDGMLGCPLYRNTDVARRRIESFFRRLCEGDSDLLAALDFGVCSPARTIRAIGSVHPDTGRHTVATTADTFLDKPRCYLWHLSEPEFEYTPPGSYPLPRRAGFVPSLSDLLTPLECRPQNAPSTEGSELNVQQYSSEWKGRIVEADGTVKGVGKGQRNDAALYVSHRMLTSCPEQASAWKRVQNWNEKNDPPLPDRELQTVFEHAAEYRWGFVDGELDSGPGGGSGQSGGRGGRLCTVCGDTKPVRHVLKEKGFWWDAAEAVWRTRNERAFRKVVEKLSAVPISSTAASVPKK